MQYDYTDSSRGYVTCGKKVSKGQTCVSPKEARHEEIKERPQLQHVVLDRSPTQDHPVLCCDALHGLQQPHM